MNIVYNIMYFLFAIAPSVRYQVSSSQKPIHSSHDKLRIVFFLYQNIGKGKLNILLDNKHAHVNK